MIFHKHCYNYHSHILFKSNEMQTVPNENKKTEFTIQLYEKSSHDILEPSKRKLPSYEDFWRVNDEEWWQYYRKVICVNPSSFARFIILQAKKAKNLELVATDDEINELNQHIKTSPEKFFNFLRAYMCLPGSNTLARIKENREKKLLIWFKNDLQYWLQENKHNIHDLSIVKEKFNDILYNHLSYWEINYEIKLYDDERPNKIIKELLLDLENELFDPKVEINTSNINATAAMKYYKHAQYAGMINRLVDDAREKLRKPATEKPPAPCAVSASVFEELTGVSVPNGSDVAMTFEAPEERYADATLRQVTNEMKNVDVNALEALTKKEAELKRINMEKQAKLLEEAKLKEEEEKRIMKELEMEANALKKQKEEEEKIQKENELSEKKRKRVKTVRIKEDLVRLSTFARQINISVQDILKIFRSEFDEIYTRDQFITAEEASLIADYLELDYELESINNPFDVKAKFWNDRQVTSEDWSIRSPIVSIMGHVDHGKTTLLDTLRNSNVAKNESGGITQSIGAFLVSIDENNNDKNHNNSIVFLDTPGHAAFHRIREKGALAADIIVLVVDGTRSEIAPQALEVILLAQKQKAALVVAINKKDVRAFNSNKIHDELLKVGVQTEARGGQVLSVDISAKSGDGLDELCESILLTSELLELKAPIKCDGEVLILENRLDPFKGGLINGILMRGQLKVGDDFICGREFGRIRILQNSFGVPVKEIKMGEPVQIAGIRSLDKIGDELIVVEDTYTARQIVDYREHERNQALTAINEKLLQANVTSETERMVEKIAKRASNLLNMLNRPNVSKHIVRKLKWRLKKLEEYANIAIMKDPQVRSQVENIVEETREGISEINHHKTKQEKNVNETPTFYCVIRCDVNGSQQAILDYISALKHPDVDVQVVNSGLGSVTVTDLNSLEDYDGEVLTFHVRTPLNITEEANRRGIKLKNFEIIYELFDYIKERVEDLAPSKIIEDVITRCDVLKVFPSRKKEAAIAGCLVSKGRIRNKDNVRVIRDGNIIHQGLVKNLKRFKDDVPFVDQDHECGISLTRFSEFEEGDIIEIISLIKSKESYNDGYARGKELTSTVESSFYMDNEESHKYATVDETQTESIGSGTISYKS